jgi:hypothetical protein
VHPICSLARSFIGTDLSSVEDVSPGRKCVFVHGRFFDAGGYGAFFYHSGGDDSVYCTPVVSAKFDEKTFE